MAWNDRAVVEWSGFLLDSYRHWIKSDLFLRRNLQWDARDLFRTSLVVVSHGLGDDPVFNYANQEALELWGLDWDSFTATPSRLSAEPMAQAEREAALRRTIEAGFVKGYSGIRITSDGRRFRIHDGVIWNVLDDQGTRVGQAATFPVPSRDDYL